MIRSMTGFGKAECELAGKRLTVELRSLNSKQLDINLRIPALYRDKETLLRNEIAIHLNRGKVDISIQLDQTGTENIPRINTGIVKNYVEQLLETGKEIGQGKYDPQEMLKIAMRMPDILINNRPEPDEAEWESVYNCFLSAVNQLNKYRIYEGEAMRSDLESRISAIEACLSEIVPHEQARTDKIRGRIEQNFNEFFSNNSIDRNRFEQEIIYYLEKLDISEEKVRLGSHIGYFRETLRKDEPSGKKLGFISQEMGREINTIGAKANDFNIQKLVVQMKDELEKVREQSLNLL
jgi:uncharacterized protein (TIGR00255 family)